MIDWICTNQGQVYPASLTGLEALELRLPLFPCLTEIKRNDYCRRIINQYGQKHEISVRNDGVLLHDGRPY